MRNRINYLIVVFFSLSILAVMSISNAASAQCNSKIKAETKSQDNNEQGEIIVIITASGNFVCRLNSVSGSGITAIDVKNDQGNKTIKFSNLDKYKIYQVEVEFLSEENQLCKKLQRNDLIFESN